MPTYSFTNKKTGEEFEQFMFISELDTFLQENPDIDTLPTAPGIISGYNMKPSEGFRDMLKQVKKTNRGSKINTW